MRTFGEAPPPPSFFDRLKTGLSKTGLGDILTKKKIGKDTDAYKAYSIGKLPPAHLHARATRYAVKLFLAHLHEVMYVQHHGRKPPLPYAIGILGHAHKIEPVM